MHSHVWEIMSYLLSRDRCDVSLVERCEDCGRRRSYERPNMRDWPLLKVLAARELEVV